MQKLSRLVPFLLKPAGFPKDRLPTQEAVNRWKRGESNSLKRLPYVTYGGAGVLAGAIMLSLESLFDKDRVGQVISGIAALCGLGGAITPLLSKKDTSVTTKTNNQILPSIFNQIQAIKHKIPPLKVIGFDE